MPDSTSFRYAFEFLGGFPTWVFMIMLLIASITTIIVVTSKSGVLTKLVDFYMGLRKNNADTEEVIKTVKAIRDDQLISNAERVKQTEKIDGLVTRMDTFETRLSKIEATQCAVAASCPNNSKNNAISSNQT